MYMYMYMYKIFSVYDIIIQCKLFCVDYIEGSYCFQVFHVHTQLFFVPPHQIIMQTYHSGKDMEDELTYMQMKQLHVGRY